MRCPTLSELPPPPPGKSGWPWTAESAQLPDTISDGAPWPRVSIVTPSYNQAQFIEETIRSVLLQGYPDLEYIIMDGGSTDGSVEIIRKYEPWLAYWVSEKDKGQSEAINKGFARTSGSFIAWLNSDDTYKPGGLARAVDVLMHHPDVDFVHGDCDIVDGAGMAVYTLRAEDITFARLMSRRGGISQATVLMRRDTWGKVGPLDESLHYTMDFEYWARILSQGKCVRIPYVLATYRKIPGTKSFSRPDLSADESLRTMRRFMMEVPDLFPTREIRERMVAQALWESGVIHYFLGDAKRGLSLLQQAVAQDGTLKSNPQSLADPIVGSLIKQMDFESQVNWGQILRLFCEAPLGLLSRLRLIPYVLGTTHMTLAFRYYEQQCIGKVRRNLPLGVCYMPRWLMNRGVWSIGIEAFLGKPVADLLRQRKWSG